MKTFNQITNKKQSLKRQLVKQAQKQGIYENFGEKEQRILDGFIGDAYEYSYQDRQKIDALTREFSSWCMNFTL